MDNKLTSIALPRILPGRLSDLRCAIVLVGGGKMGIALLTGWLEAGLAPALVRIVDPHPSEMLLAFAEANRIALTRSPPMVSSAVIVIAVKPQSSAEVAIAFEGRLGDDCVVLSIMAGVQIARLRAMFPAAASIVRAMPNLPASVGLGATLVVAEAGLDPESDREIDRILSVSGLVERFADEFMLDAGTALSGSGPGFLFLLVDCLAEAAHRAGLPLDVARRLARRTVEGTGALLLASPKEPNELSAEVASPGGTTQAGLAVLASDDRLTKLLTETLLASTARSRQLGAS